MPTLLSPTTPTPAISVGSTFPAYAASPTLEKTIAEGPIHLSPAKFPLLHNLLDSHEYRRTVETNPDLLQETRHAPGGGDLAAETRHGGSSVGASGTGAWPKRLLSRTASAARSSLSTAKYPRTDARRSRQHSVVVKTARLDRAMRSPNVRTKHDVRKPSSSCRREFA